MTSTSAFRLLSAPSGTYNKAPSGIFAAGLPAFTRGALGAFSLPGAEDFRRPPKPPKLYEFQACPFCRKAREALSLLALDAVFYPCPKNGTAFRPLAAEMATAAGKARPQFPLLVEEGEAPLFESDAIVSTLFEKFGPTENKSCSSIPWQLRPGNFFGKASLGFSAAPRAGKGRAAAFAFGDDEAGRSAEAEFAASRRAMKPLVLWGYEPSPYVTLVREKLTELELPHLYMQVPRLASKKRAELCTKWEQTAATTEAPEGKFQVPYVEDPNNVVEGRGAALYETGPILKYLDEEYGPKKG